MRVVILGVLVCLSVIHANPYNRYGSQRESRFTVHEKPPELVVNAGPEGVKVQAKPSKLQVIEYPHRRSGGTSWGGGGFGGNGCGVISHEGAGMGGDGCGNRGEGGWLSSGHENWMHGGGGNGFGAGFGGGYGGGGHHEHTTYVPSHTPPVHVGPNAPPIHVGPHVPAVHVGPHVPSIHYGTHAPLYHVGPHVPFVHMPPPVTTVHAGPMGPPVHVSSPPTVYHQPPVVYHQPHVVGHASDHGFGHGYGVGGYYGGNTGYGASHYGGHDDECCGETGHSRGYGGGGYGGGGRGGYMGGGGYGGRGGGYGGGGGYARGYGRSNIPKQRKQKRSIQGESDDEKYSMTADDTTERNKRQMPYYGWHPFPASVHVGPHTPPIHIGPHYPPVHIGPHVPAVHIGPHVPYINIPAHVPAIHVRPHVPAVHISPPVPIINAGNHVPAVHVTSPPTVYHRPPIVIHQPHIVHSPNRGNGQGHEIYGQEPRDGGYGNGLRDNGYMRQGGQNIQLPHDGGFGGGYNGQGGFNGAMGKRNEIPIGYYNEFEGTNPGKLSLRHLYSMVRPRRQLLGGSSDGGDSVIFVHPSGSSSPVGGSITGDSPLAGLESPSLPGAAATPSHSSLGGSSQMESPSLPGSTGNAFAKSGLSGLSSLTNNLASPETSFPALSSHGLPGLSNLAPNLPHDFGNIAGGLSSLNNNLESSNGLSSALPDGMSASMSLPSASQNQHDDSFSAETPNMNIGGLQGGFNEDASNSHSSEESTSLNNFQRSLFPSSSYARYIDNADNANAEQNYNDINIDSSTERDLKSFIPHEEEDEDRHERVHKDIIPRPEGLGY